jgi:Ger(x)C family germination protein
MNAAQRIRSRIRKRFKRSIIVTILLAMLFPLTGCWNAREIQELAFVHSIGVDYYNDKFEVTLAFYNLSSVDPNAGVNVNMEIPVWITQGRGGLLQQAINDALANANLLISWGHVTAMVLSERALFDVGTSILDLINRFPDTRHNAYIYVTRESLDELFLASDELNRSPLISKLHAPSSSYQQNSFMVPVQLFSFISRRNEAPRTGYIPSVNLNRGQWRNKEGDQPMFAFDGAYFGRGDVVSDLLDRNDLEGYRWTMKQMMHSLLPAEKDGKVYTLSVMRTNSVHITADVHGDDVKFVLQGNYIGGLYEYLNDISDTEMRKLMEERIKREVMHTYNVGLAKGLDIYCLEEALFRKNPKLWKKLTNDGESIMIDKDSLVVDVHVSVPYYGKYEREINGDNGRDQLQYGPEFQFHPDDGIRLTD